MNRFTVYSWLLGFAGGFLLFFVEVPLAWLLGSMIAASMAAIAGLKIDTFKVVTPWSRCVLGAMVGTGFDSVNIDELLSYWTTLTIVPLFVLLTTFFTFKCFKHIFGFDSLTAIFSALPGGMVEMVTTGREMGADIKVLTIVHLMRVVIIVVSAALMGLFIGVKDLKMQIPSFNHFEYIFLHLILGLLGWKFLEFFKVPSAPLLGPMFLVAALQGFGFVHLELFTPLIILAQVAIGIDIAQSFFGVSIASMWRALLAGITSILITIIVLCFCAFLMFLASSNILWEQIILSLLPGGQTELALLAFALELDLTFVVTHQMSRIALIMFSLPLLLLSLKHLGQANE